MYRRNCLIVFVILLSLAFIGCGDKENETSVTTPEVVTNEKAQIDHLFYGYVDKTVDIGNGWFDIYVNVDLAVYPYLYADEVDYADITVKFDDAKVEFDRHIESNGSDYWLDNMPGVEQDAFAYDNYAERIKCGVHYSPQFHPCEDPGGPFDDSSTYHVVTLVFRNKTQWVLPTKPGFGWYGTDGNSTVYDHVYNGGTPCNIGTYNSDHDVESWNTKP